MFERFIREEEGAGMAEYAILIVVIALVAAVGGLVLGEGLSDIFDALGSEFAAQGVSLPS